MDINDSSHPYSEANDPYGRRADYGVQVTRNGHGIHIGTYSQGALSDLAPDQARELLAKLTEALAR